MVPVSSEDRVTTQPVINRKKTEKQRKESSLKRSGESDYVSPGG